MCSSFNVFGQNSSPSYKTVDLSTGKNANLLENSQYLADVRSELTWQSSIDSKDWIETIDGAMNFGITESTYWFRLSLKFLETQTQIFQIHYSLLDYVDFYLIEENKLVKHIATGDALPFDSRVVKDKDFAFLYKGTQGQEATLLIKVKTNGTMVLPLTVTSIENYAQSEAIENIGYGLYFGITIAMLVYNLMLYVYLREKSYLYYCLFVTSICVSVSSYTGHGFYWIWPNTSIINSYLAPLSIGFGFLTSVLFMSSFLEVRRRGVLGERVYRVSIGISLLVILSAILLSYSNAIRIMSIAQISLTIVIMSFSIYLWRKGVVEAKYFTIAWTFFVLGNLINSMRVVGVMPSNNFTFYANLYGNIIEMLLLSMGLAYRFETMRESQIALSRELRLAQQDAIGNLERFRDLFKKSPVGLFRYDRGNNKFTNNIKAIDLIGDSNNVNKFLQENLSFSDYKALLKKGDIKDRVIKLEGEVYYNLSLLAVRNELGRVVEVEGTLSDISSQKQAEANRITNEKEKLNTLTQLVVGISHQFNTPLGVLVTTEDLVKKNLTDILEDIDGGKLKKNELLQNLLMIQDAMNLSSENTKVMSTILNNLRYSISTRRDLNLSNINFDCFFTDLFGYYKAQLKEIGQHCSFTVAVELNDVKSIRCDYDIISDIFVRLYENSYSHAYSASGEDVSNGLVSIILSEDEDSIFVEYYDDGRGLDEAEQENIFIPFFTGNSRKKENSGLGMYILHNQVVKILNGKIELLSPETGFGIKLQIPKVNIDAVDFK
jgi:signal transduction histidine kinase